MLVIRGIICYVVGYLVGGLVMYLGIKISIWYNARKEVKQ